METVTDGRKTPPVRAAGSTIQPVLAPAKFALLWAVVSPMTLTACSSASSSPTAIASAPVASTSVNGNVANAWARQTYLSGVHSTPVSNVRIERAVTAPLSAVKTWVLTTEPELEWATWSRALATTPLEERVAVCVYSKVDGSSFTPAPGANTPKPTQSLVAVVTGDGASTLYMMGDTASMLSATPTRFAG